MVLRNPAASGATVLKMPREEKTAKASADFSMARKFWRIRKSSVQQIKEMNMGRLPALQPKGKDHEPIGGILIGCQPESRKGLNKVFEAGFTEEKHCRYDDGRHSFHGRDYRSRHHAYQ